LYITILKNLHPMHRKQFLRHSGLTLAGLMLLNKSNLAAFLSGREYNIRMLSDNAGIFTEKGGTILFTLTGSGVVVVDSQFPDTAPHLIDELSKKTTAGFNMLINTHHHGDHTSGNIAFKDIVAKVLAHENSKINQQNAAVQNKSEDKQLYPTDIYKDTWSANIDKEKISLHYFGAGHTNGDSIVHFENANIIHMGDLVFNRRHPYVDRKAGAHVKSWISVLNRTVETFSDKTQFVCGHAAAGYDVVIKKEDIRAFAKYLSDMYNYVEGAVKAGKTKEEILKTTEIPGSPEWKGDGIERPLNAAYAEITEK